MKRYKVEVWRYHIRDFRYFDSWKKAAEFISEDTDEHFITEIEYSKTKKKVENNFFVIGDIWHKATKYKTFEDFYNAVQEAYKKDEEEKKKRIAEFENMKPINLTEEKVKAFICNRHWRLNISPTLASLEFSFYIPCQKVVVIGDRTFAVPKYEYSEANKIIINDKEYSLLSIGEDSDSRGVWVLVVKVQGKTSEISELFNTLQSNSEFEINLKGGEE